MSQAILKTIQSRVFVSSKRIHNDGRWRWSIHNKNADQLWPEGIAKLKHIVF